MSSFDNRGRPPAMRGVGCPPDVTVFVVALVASIMSPSAAHAQQPAQGFAVERLYPSAPGGGWFVMDDLNIDGGLGGAVALTSGYARQPLKMTGPDGTQHLSVVSNEAFVDVGLAATYHRYRVYLGFPMPLLVNGTSAAIGSYEFTAPDVSLGMNPDSIADARVGFDVRLFGAPGSSLRLGASGQLIIPFAARADYITDGTFRGMVRALVAGDVGRYAYAGQVGVHVRPLDEAPTPPSPAGSELLFGFSAGRRMSIGADRLIIIGPEFYGETAFRAFFGGTTGFEGLMTARLEGTRDDGPHIRVKLGAGGGVDRQFGTPEWRIVAGVELVGRRSARTAARP